MDSRDTTQIQNKKLRETEKEKAGKTKQPWSEHKETSETRFEMTKVRRRILD